MAEYVRRHGLLRVIALALALNSSAALAAEPLKIRIGWANTPATISPLLFQKTDIMRHYGSLHFLI